MSYKTNATNGEEKDEMHADTFVFDFASFSNRLLNYLFCQRTLKYSLIFFDNHGMISK